MGRNRRYQKCRMLTSTEAVLLGAAFLGLLVMAFEIGYKEGREEGAASIADAPDTSSAEQAE